jgi:hypothetical protein
LAYRRIDGPIARVARYRVAKLRIRSGVHAPTVAGSLQPMNLSLGHAARPSGLSSSARVCGRVAAIAP